MRMLYFSRWTTISMALLVCLPVVTAAQPAKIPFHREPYFVDSGLHDGQVGPGAKTFVAFREVIQIPGAPWLRLQFQAHDLGRKDSITVNPIDSATVEGDSIGSYLTITSLEDGATQRLDAFSLEQWRNTSAYFNGDAVEIALHVAPRYKGIFFEIMEVMVGEHVGQDSEGLPRAGEIKTICGGIDDRVASDDPAVGRVLELAGGDRQVNPAGGGATLLYISHRRWDRISPPLRGQYLRAHFR